MFSDWETKIQQDKITQPGPFSKQGAADRVELPLYSLALSLFHSLDPS